MTKIKIYITLLLLILLITTIILIYTKTIENMSDLASSITTLNNSLVPISSDIDTLSQQIKTIYDVLFGQNGLTNSVNDVYNWQQSLIGKKITYTIPSQCVDVVIPSIPGYDGYDNNNININKIAGISGSTQQVCTPEINADIVL